MTALLTFISKSLVFCRPCSLHTLATFRPVLFFSFSICANRLSSLHRHKSKVFISDPGQHFLSFQLAAPPIFPTTATTPGVPSVQDYSETMAPTIKNSSPPTSSNSNDEVLETKKRKKKELFFAVIIDKPII